jgi:UDP-N-acetyl-D-mannosaminuronate dehydrogenase
VKPEVAIVGAGYVGLPLGRLFAETGIPVVLVDIDTERVETINRGESHVEDVPSEALATLVEAGTTYPGTTRGEALPIPAQSRLENAQLVADFRNATGKNGSVNGRVWKL